MSTALSEFISQKKGQWKIIYSLTFYLAVFIISKTPKAVDLIF